MRRLVFLLLAFWCSWQAFAGTPASAPAASMPLQFSMGSVQFSQQALPASAQTAELQAVATPLPAPDLADCQDELEDHALPLSALRLVLDWQPFPHRFPDLHAGSTADIGLLRPPPLMAA